MVADVVFPIRSIRQVQHFEPVQLGFFGLDELPADDAVLLEQDSVARVQIDVEKEIPGFFFEVRVVPKDGHQFIVKVPGLKDVDVRKVVLVSLVLQVFRILLVHRQYE